MKTSARAVSVIAALALMAAASAQTTTWIGPPTGDWFDEANWSLGIPDSTTRAVVDVDGPLDLLIDLTPAFAQGLTVAGGQVNIRTLDALAELRLDTSLGVVPTIEVTGAGTSATVTGEVALALATVRGGASLLLDGHLDGLQRLEVDSVSGSVTSLGLRNTSLDTRFFSVRRFGDGEAHATFERIYAPDTAISLSGEGVSGGSTRLEFSDSWLRSLRVAQTTYESNATLLLNDVTITEGLTLQNSEVVVAGVVRIVGDQQPGRGAVCDVEFGSITLRDYASLEVDRMSGLSRIDSIRGGRGSQFIVHQSRLSSSSIVRPAYITLGEFLGAEAVYFGPRQPTATGVGPELYSALGYIVHIQDSESASQGFRGGGSFEVHGALLVSAPAELIGCNMKQRIAWIRFAGIQGGNQSDPVSVLVFEGLHPDWNQDGHITMERSRIESRDLLILRDVDLHGYFLAENEIAAYRMWIGDGVFRMIPEKSEGSAPVRVAARTLVVGGDFEFWKRSTFRTTNDTPAAVLTGQGEIIGSLVNAGRIEPGDRIGRVHVEGTYTQQQTLADRPPSRPRLSPVTAQATLGPGTLAMDLVSPDTGHDLLTIDGDALLGGALELHYPEGEPADGDFEIVTATRIDGRFDTVDAPPLSAGRSAQVIYTPTSVIVRIGVLGDVNGDGVVNGRDIAAWVSLAKDNDPAADINGDGAINGGDLAAILSNWTGK